MESKKKDEFKPYVVFDQEDAIGVPERPYKRADFNDLSKGQTENDDIIYLGVGGAGSIPNPLVNFVFQASDGSLSSPGISWASDTDTGFYRTSSGVFSVSINGTKEVEFNSSGIAIPDMTAGSVLFAGTSGQITQDNSSLFFNNTSNRLGIGTSSPTRTLQAAKSGEPQFRLDATGGYYVDFECDGNSDLEISPAAGLGTKMTFTGADDNTTYYIEVENTNTATTGGGASLYMQVSSAGGDPYIVWDIVGGSNWIMGADNSDSDKFKLTTGALSGFSGTKGLFITTGIYTSFTPAVASTGTAYAVDISGAINTGGSNGLFRVLAAASTGQTASTEINFVNFDLGATTTWATGAITSQRAIFMEAPTLAFAGSSTVTNAATLYIDRAPQAGSNATITNPYSLWIGGGKHIRADGTNTVASAAAAVWNAILFDMDVSVSGSTNITTATGFNMVTLNAPTVTDAGTMGTITNSATLYVGGAPTGSGLTITNAYALWVDDGAVRIDGALTVGSFTLSGFTSTRVLYAGASGAVSEDADFTWNDGTNTLSATNATVATSLTLSALTASRLMATDGSKVAASVTNLQSWIAGTANQVVTADDGDGTITLSLPQSIHTAATPTFSSLTLSGLTSGRVVFATTSGLLTDDAGFTFDGATLTLADGHATTTPLAVINNSSTGDSALRWTVGTTASYIAGIDNSDSDSWKLSYAASGTAVLGTNDYLTVLVGGNVGIGTTGPDAKLDVLSTSAQLRLTNTDGVDYTDFTTDGDGLLTVAPSGGAVVIADAYLDVSGASSAIYASYSGSIYTQLNTDSSGNFLITPTGADVAIVKSVVGSDLRLVFFNTDNTNASSGSRLQFSVGGASAGDPQIRFLISGVSQYSVGIDNSDADTFKISGSGALGTLDYLTVAIGGDIGIGTSTFPSAGSGKVLVFGDNAAQPTMGTNTAGVYAYDSGTGTVELYGVDEAGNDTQLTPHNRETGEWWYNSVNRKTGKRLRVHMERLVKHLVENNLIPSEFVEESVA